MKRNIIGLLLAGGLLFPVVTRGESVQVVLPDGTPAAGATAASLVGGSFLHIRNGEVIKHYSKALPVLSEDGHIEIPEKEFGRWVFLHPEGWADTIISANVREVHLESWKTLRGILAPDLRGDPPATVGFSRLENRVMTPDDPGNVYWTSEAATAEDGSFSLWHLPSGVGVVGLMREFKNDRRIQRWKDFPREVTVPSDTPVSLSRTGVDVRGRLEPGLAAPALVTLFDLVGRMPPHFGVADRDGVFVVSGVPPGRYRMVARPLDASDGRYHLQRELSIGEGGSPVDLGEWGDPATDVEVYRQVEFPTGLIERVREVAAGQCARPIRKIWLGQLVHPVNLWGARVTFEPEPTDKTHAIARTFVVRIPGANIRKFYPEHDTEGYGYRFGEGDFFEPKMFEKIVRVFPLNHQTLHMEVQEPLDYETALALLKAIEAGTWKHRENPVPSPNPDKDGITTRVWRSRTVSGGDLTAADLPQIDSIRREKHGGPIKVQTHDFDFGGKTAEFEEQNGEFILISGGRWVS